MNNRKALQSWTMLPWQLKEALSTFPRTAPTAAVALTLLEDCNTACTRNFFLHHMIKWSRQLPVSKLYCYCQFCSSMCQWNDRINCEECPWSQNTSKVLSSSPHNSMWEIKADSQWSLRWKKVQSHFPFQYKSIQILEQMYLPYSLLRALYLNTGLVLRMWR